MSTSSEPVVVEPEAAEGPPPSVERFSPEEEAVNQIYVYIDKKY